MENKNNETFTYSYSAKQQEEIKNIRKKYLPPEEDKMEQLRRLDASVTTPGMIASLAAGILGTLILGVGMCCCMVWSGVWFIPGIIIGVTGIVILALAYPLYVKLTERQRRKFAPEIIRLTEELMK